MWGIILIVAVALLGAGFVYLTVCFSRFGFIKKLAGEVSVKRRLFGLLCIAAIMAALTITLGVVNAAICIVNLLLFFIIADIVGLIIRKAAKKERKHYFEGYAALLAAVIYLCIGFYLANGVWEKDYSLKTDKDIGQLKIIQFADSHVGTTFDGEGLNKYIDEMNELDPDIVVITGDFVDDDTDRENMIAASAAVGRLKTKYGVYYCFGNHDKGYYDNSRRGYNSDDLVAELEKNGVTVLEDESVLVDNRFYVVGRADKSEELEGRSGYRKPIDELMQGLDKDKYTIVLDHQPNDYDAESKANADLVLSGHTHGGQMLPINRIGEWIGANDYTYGYKRIGSTDFIVTSGISDWAIDFKTGCRSEYVVIDVSEN
ncbi:MAG: metallophosphoesterase [Ruminococcus sp.]|nr:metallophosphoesterase [Ruminococcus sp.]